MRWSPSCVLGCFGYRRPDEDGQGGRMLNLNDWTLVPSHQIISYPLDGLIFCWPLDDFECNLYMLQLRPRAMDGEPRCRAKKLARRQTTSIWNVGFVLGFLSYSHIFSTLPSKKFPKICLKTTLYTLPKCRGILYMNPERTTDSAKLLMRRLILREFVDPSDRGSGWD